MQSQTPRVMNFVPPLASFDLAKLVLAVHCLMAGCAKRDQILLDIISQLAARSYVMDFESL